MDSLPKCETGVNMVVGCNKLQSSPTPQKGSDTLPDHRRSGCGLGSSPKQPISLREMGATSEVLALQPEGDVCSICSDKGSTCSITRCTHSSAVRQSNPNRLHKKSGWNTFHESTTAHNQTIGDDSFPQHNNDCILSPRQSERNSRPLVKGTTTTRVASTTTCHGGDFQKVGIPRYRPVCLKRNRRRSALRIARFQRWISDVLRRIQPKLGLSNSVGLSTTQPNSQGTSTIEQSKGNIHLNSTRMEPMFLVSRPTSKGASQTYDNREPERESSRLDNRPESSTSGQIKTPGLENWGWADQVADWNTEEQQLLLKSWRPSTLSTYSTPIRRWQLWCSDNKINSRNPTGKDVARFLANLYLKNKFSYSTILLHKSAISTYCAATVDNLSNNFFIQQVLKTISISKPQPVRTPIWDINMLFSWLKSSPCSASLFDISRRTAIILLLASGRRLHDLTLLEVSEEGFTETETSVTLWPKFGSKTDSGSHRQSGWLLTKHQDYHICPVTHVKKLIESSKERHNLRTEVKSLFITVKGEVKPASRTVISTWVRSVFREANIDASPGSIRSAVASRGWLDNRPIDDILERGNWKCVQTFKKFYCKEVNRPNCGRSDLLHNNFKNV